MKYEYDKVKWMRIGKAGMSENMKDDRMSESKEG